jgi:peptidoglycan/LPS O-acetylase OafA/YrhL
VARTGTRRVAHQPALDGVRGVAVALVLLFHQEWLSGGYVGVSVFFTLSGYLITTLALAEHDATPGLDVRAFYGRRVRRLMPASLACLLGVAVLGLFGVFSSVEHLRRDLWAALAPVYNWVALGAGTSYAELVGTGGSTRSPLEHFWSLAIEEQFYWVWPLALVVILRRSTRGRLVLIGGLTAVFALAAPLIAHSWGPDAAYWATPARLGEILVGALLAVVLHARQGRPLPAAAAGLAGGGLAAVVCAAVLWPSGSGPAYTGWLPVFALGSVALIAGLQVPSPVRRALSWPPLVALGAISFGVYLFHWPVFVLLDEERTHLPTVVLFALRIAVTLALAIVSYRHLERPVRAVRVRPRVVGVAAVVACASMAAVAATVPAAAARPYWMPDGADDASTADVVPTAPAPVATTTTTTVTSVATPPVETTTTATTASSPSSVAAPPTSVDPPDPTTLPAALVPSLPGPPERPVRVLVVGDSTAMATATGLVNWSKLNPVYLKVSSAASTGCGFVADGAQAMDARGSFAKQCKRVRTALPKRQAAFHPDVVVGMVTLTDVDRRSWSADEGPLEPMDPRFHDRLVAAYDAATQELLANGATDVVWIVPLIPTVAYGEARQYLLEPARYAAYGAALREVASHFPGQVEVADLAAWAATLPAPPDRPDGLHWSRSAALDVAEQFLAPVLVNAGLT